MVFGAIVDYKADIWAEMHVDWNRSDDAVLSQGAALLPSEFLR